MSVSHAQETLHRSIAMCSQRELMFPEKTQEKCAGNTRKYCFTFRSTTSYGENGWRCFFGNNWDFYQAGNIIGRFNFPFFPPVSLEDWGKLLWKRLWLWPTAKWAVHWQRRKHIVHTRKHRCRLDTAPSPKIAVGEGDLENEKLIDIGLYRSLQENHFRELEWVLVLCLIYSTEKRWAHCGFGACLAPWMIYEFLGIGSHCQLTRKKRQGLSPAFGTNRA